MKNQRNIKPTGDKKISSAFNGQSRGQYSTPSFATALIGSNPNYKTFNAINGYQNSNNKNRIEQNQTSLRLKSLRKTAADDEDDAAICLPTKDSLLQGNFINQNSQVQTNCWDSWDNNTDSAVPQEPKKPEEILGGCMSFVVNNSRIKDIQKDNDVYEPDQDEEDENLDLKDIAAIAALEESRAQKKKEAQKAEVKTQELNNMNNQSNKPQLHNRFLQENYDYNRHSGISNNFNENRHKNQNNAYDAEKPQQNKGDHNSRNDQKLQKGSRDDHLNNRNIERQQRNKNQSRNQQIVEANTQSNPCVPGQEENHNVQDDNIMFNVNKNRVIYDDQLPQAEQKRPFHAYNKQNSTQQNNGYPKDQIKKNNNDQPYKPKNQGVIYVPKNKI